MLSLYENYTVEQAVAAFGSAADSKFFCEGQFAVVPGATLCFATMGDPENGTKLLSPSKMAWKPARLDYHPEERTSWLPERLTECVERGGAWLPLHHMFLRAPDDRQFIYAGIAELNGFGDIPEYGKIQQAAHFSLDTKLPRDFWVLLGGHAGWLVGFNNTERRFDGDDVIGFERLLAGVPTKPGYWQVWLTGYEEQWFSIQFNSQRARLRYGPGGEQGVESWDPDCAWPRKDEFFGDDGHDEVTFAAERTVPRELAVRAAVEYFKSGRLPESVRWREIDEVASHEST